MGIHQLAGDPRHIRRPQLIQRDADHAGRGAASLRHLPAPVRQVGGAVSEGGVTGEFRLPRRDQHVSRADVVGAADGIAPALAGIGHQDLAVEAYRQLLFQLLAQRLRLQRIMAPQSGVALGQQLKFSSALPCRPRQIAGKLPVDPLRLPAGKAAGIGQYKNHVSRFPQGPQKHLHTAAVQKGQKNIARQYHIRHNIRQALLPVARQELPPAQKKAQSRQQHENQLQPQQFSHHVIVLLGMRKRKAPPLRGLPSACL